MGKPVPVRVWPSAPYTKEETRSQKVTGLFFALELALIHVMSGRCATLAPPGTSPSAPYTKEETHSQKVTGLFFALEWHLYTLCLVAPHTEKKIHSPVIKGGYFARPVPIFYFENGYTKIKL